MIKFWDKKRASENIQGAHKALPAKWASGEKNGTMDPEMGLFIAVCVMILHKGKTRKQGGGPKYRLPNQSWWNSNYLLTKKRQ